MGLSIGIFIVPTIALSLVMLLYFYFKGQVEHKKGYRKLVMTITVTAYILNLIWEVAQGPFYREFEYDLRHFFFCALASIADTLMVLLLFFVFALIYNNAFWTGNMGIKRIGSLMSVGGIGAIFAELWHVTRVDWSYAEAMPLMPIIEVGLTPVLQFALLPWLVFYSSNKMILTNTRGIKL